MVGAVFAGRLGVQRATASFDERVGQQLGAVLAQQDRYAGDGLDIVRPERHARLLGILVAVATVDLNEPGHPLIYVSCIIFC